MSLQTRHLLISELILLSSGLAGMFIAWGVGVAIFRALVEGHDRFDGTFYSGCGVIALLFFAVLLAARSWAKRHLIAVTTQIRIERAVVGALAVAAVIMSVVADMAYPSGWPFSYIGPYTYIGLSTSVCFVLAAIRKWNKTQPIAGANFFSPVAFSCTSLAILFIAFWSVLLPAMFLRVVTIYGGEPIVERFLLGFIALLHLSGVSYVWSVWRKVDVSPPLR